ncbi:unnamed protein product, partial [Mesorhabditis belari]|uniref:MARVEL domain-containing protein n=1 Tax=Mesorhabditis belari TaxID=2138241 RepID=A0AAF3FGU3_9BILA
MEAVGQNADWDFFKKQPFGMLMAGQTILSLIFLILPVFSAYFDQGGWLAFSTSSCLFLTSLVMNLLHLFRLNRRTIQAGNAAFFVPCALIIFISSVIFGFLYLFSTLAYLVAFIQSLSYGFRHILWTFIGLVMVILLSLVNLYLGILLYRAAPNSRLMALTTIVIEGSKTEFLEGRGPQFSPTSPNPPPNPQFSI